MQGIKDQKSSATAVTVVDVKDQKATVTADIKFDPQYDKTLEGRSDTINAIIMLPNGRLASGSSDKSIKL